MHADGVASQARTVRRQVEDPPVWPPAYGGGVEQHEIRVIALRDPAAIRNSENLCWFFGQFMNRCLQSEGA